MALNFYQNPIMCQAQAASNKVFGPGMGLRPRQLQQIFTSL
jgi:hypothetical protein